MKTFRVYISGKISSRTSQTILHNMMEDLGLTTKSEQFRNMEDQIPTVRNMHREDDYAYFDVNIPNESDALSIVDSIKRYIIENSVQYEDITDQPPKNL